jgi:hypothetical protein
MRTTLKQKLLNAFYIAFTGAVLGSFMYGALGAGVSHLTH